MVVEAEKQILVTWNRFFSERQFLHVVRSLAPRPVSVMGEVVVTHGLLVQDREQWEPGQWLGTLTPAPTMIYSWALLAVGAEEMGEGISPVPEGSQGIGEATSDFQSGTHVGSRSRRICASHTSSWPRKCITDLGFKRMWSVDCPGGPWLRICLLIQGTQVWSLVRELRSHMPQGK